MSQFSALLQDLGFSDVRTLLNSGNAVFSSSGRSAARHANAIGKALHERLALTVPVVVKSAAELAAVVDANPLASPPAEHARVLVVFGQDAQALEALAPIASMTRAPERLVLMREAGFLHCPAGILESPAGKALLGKAGQGLTTRNWATVLKLATLVGADAT